MARMAFRFQRSARRRAAVAGVLGLALVVVVGPLLTIPAVALVALVYYGHQLAAVLAGDEGVPYPSLAFVIVVNALIVLLVQVVVFVEGFNARV
jgi:hypothetical protein